MTYLSLLQQPDRRRRHPGATHRVGRLRRKTAVILFDSAYEAYIRSPTSHSIYEIAGARGSRSVPVSPRRRAYWPARAYTVVPKSLLAYDAAATRTRCTHPGIAATPEIQRVAYPIQKPPPPFTPPRKQQTAR